MNLKNKNDEPSVPVSADPGTKQTIGHQPREPAELAPIGINPTAPDGLPVQGRR